MIYEALQTKLRKFLEHLAMIRFLTWRILLSLLMFDLSDAYLLWSILQIHLTSERVEDEAGEFEE